MLGEPFPQSIQSGPIGVNATAPQLSIHQAERRSYSPGQRKASGPPASSRKEEEDIAWTSGREDDHDPLGLGQIADQFSRTFSRIKSHSPQIPARNSQSQSPGTPVQTQDHPSPHLPPTTSNSSTDRLSTSSATTLRPAVVVESPAAAAAAAAENDILSTIDSRLQAFEREEALKQRQHEEGLDRRQQQQHVQL